MTLGLRGRLIAGVAAATLLIALNIAALTYGWRDPALVGAAVALDVAALALAFWLAWRQSLRGEEAYARQKRETARVQAALTDTETRFAAILESAMDAVITVDESQKVVLFNRAAEVMFGCTREAALGGTLERFLPERFRRTHQGYVQRFGEAGVTNRRMGYNTVLWALRGDGTEFPIEASISQARADGRRLFTVVLRDVTRRKEAEDALRQSEIDLRALSARVLEAREDEKTAIARELHDELGQQLTALKMDLAWVRERIGADHAGIGGKLAEMNALLDATVKSTRRIATDLRPLMLDDLGLADAAEWLVEDFAKRSGIECEFALGEAIASHIVDRPVATALYRILQESLTNVARHAGARQVRVSLDIEGAEAALVVEDDGRGIADADRSKTLSFGLKGMRERAHYLGGSAAIEAMAQGGTRVAVRLPISVQAAA